MPRKESDDDIVISGISGRYPESGNINEFWDKLMSGKELSSIDDRRWPVGLHQLPKRTGKVPDAEKFDASFFKITDQEANWMDPQIRIFHETTYEAFVDSGNDPASFKGSNTGVYIGWCYSDTDSALKEDEAKIVSYLQLASSRVSAAFGFRGVSLGVDTACASSFTAFHQALCAMRSGVCDSALVGGWAIHLRPSLAVCFHQLMMISTDGRSKCMDARADGYCRSEAIVSVLLQRRSEAKRVYATVLNARTNTDGFKIEGITFPSIALQTQLMQETYSEARVDPTEVDYVEAHMTGTAAGDPVESAAIAAVLCKDRKDGLLVGCLKSNMGHSEGASGLCAITKSCLAFQRRMLPPNIHFKVPNETIESLKTGQLKPVLEKRPYDGSLIGLNCFGFGGCNVHAIIRANEKVMNFQSVKITSPTLNRLITFCGRTSESIYSLQSLIERNPDSITSDYCALLHDISSIPPENGMIYRSYFILDEERKIISNRDVRIREKKPLVFILPGFGPIVEGMKNKMMSFDSYRQSKERSEKLFQEMSHTYNGNKESKLISTMFEIVSHQIAMIDFLSELNIHPEYVIGTSIGELSAAYKDKCLTLEQIILSVIQIGMKLNNVSRPEFKMYKITGISVEDATKGKPIPDFEIIAIYSGQNFLVSATEEALNIFQERLHKNDGFGIQNIELMNSVMHTTEASTINTELLTSLKKETSLSSIGKNERSYKWLSTSIENIDWYKNVKMNISYMIQMISSKVNLYQVYDYIPKDSTLIEISPFGESLSSALREGMGPDVSIISIHPSTSSDELLSALGEMYLAGINPNVKSLYPVVKYPVCRETASISPLLKWKHDKSYLLTRTPDFFDYVKCNQPFQIDMMEPRYQYLAGHKVDGRILFPATGYLWLVWDIFAHIRGYKGEAGKAMLHVGVEFKEVEFKRATILPKSGAVTLNVLILTSLGRFTVTEGGTTCVTGYIRLCPADPSTEKLDKLIKVQDDGKEKIVLSPSDIYKDFKVRGYDYGPTFQGLQEATSDGSSGKVKWIENWVSFSDSMFQLAIFGSETRQLLLPTYIDYMKCDIRALVKEVDKISSENGLITLTFDKVGNVGGCPGMFIRGLKASPAPRRLNQKPLIEVQSFTPYDQTIPVSYKKLKTLVKYDKLCSELITKKLIEGTWSDEDQEMVTQEIGASQRATLLSVLNEAKSVDQLKELLANMKNEDGEQKLSQDMLLTSHDAGHMIRSQIDVILENVQSGKKINMYEIATFNKTLNEQMKVILDSNSIPFDCHSLGKDASGKISFPSKQIDADLFLLQGSNLNFGYEMVGNSEAENSDVSLNEHVQKTYEIMSSGSFMMIMSRSKNWETENLLSKLFAPKKELKSDSVHEIVRVASKIGLVNIASKWDETTGLMTLLFRKPDSESLTETEMVNVKLIEYEWVEELKEKLSIKEGEKRKKVWLIANDSSFNGVVGLVNSLRKEDGGSNIRCLFNPVDENNNNPDESFCMKKLMAKDLTMNIVKNGQLGSYRFQKVDDVRNRKPVEDAYLDVATKGDLSSLTFFKSKEQKVATLNSILPGHNHQHNVATMTKYQIYYSALNFKDIMVASGRIPTNAYPQEAMKEGNLGMEFSGKDKNGNRIMGMTQTNAIATSIVVPDVLTWKVPNWMSLKDAATIPVAYVTVYYSLLIRGNLLPGESVLIHAGTGAVGQAAINLALSMGCNIFTTVGTRAKREFIRKMYPSIPECRILNSRDVSFELEVLRQTDGRGVDVILNSLAEDKMKASFRCLAEFGRFLEIGKYDIVQNNPFDRADFADNKTFHAICLAHLMHETFIEKSISSSHVVTKLKKLVDEGLKSGVVKPLTSHIFDKTCPEEAFRFMASGKHIGKVLLRIRSDHEDDSFHNKRSVETTKGNIRVTQEEPEVLPEQNEKSIDAVIQTYFDPEKSYIITGGLGGFGLELTYWLIERGGKKILLTSRSGIKTPYQKLSMKRFKESGANVQVVNHDVSTLDSAVLLIKQAQNLGPVGGIFHLAMVLNDALFENQTMETFEKVCSPKVRGTINLDTASEGCALDYFVCFSSVACGRGNIGQTNYSFANSVMERVCEERRGRGLPGLAIQWGAIGDVGVVADYMGGNEVSVGGTIPQRMPSCFEVLDSLLQSSIGSVLSSIVLADHKMTIGSGEDDLLKVICHVLGVKDPSTLDPHSTLGDLGMDSLMAVEIRQGLERDYDVLLTAQEVRSLKISDLQSFKRAEKKQTQPSNVVETPKVVDDGSVIKI